MTTHDYTHQHWGHAVNFKPTGTAHDIAGTIFGPRIRKGDYLILPNGDRTTRYEITEIRWFGDPDDMYSFTARFAPRGSGA